MAVIAQWNGVRVVAFNKSGHTSLINMFLTPKNAELSRGNKPMVINSSDRAKEVGAYRGDINACQSWPKPDAILAFFRDPFRRSLSAYQHFLVRTLKERDGVRTVGRKSFEDLGFTAGMTFREFVFHLPKIDLNKDAHLEPQFTSLDSATPPDTQVYIYRLEDINDNWAKIVEAHDLSSTTDVANYNTASYDPTPYMFDADVTAIISDLYKADETIWGNCGSMH